MTRKKCNIVRDAISSANPSLLCLQETKLHAIDRFKVKTFLLAHFAESFSFLPAIGSRGGILTAWNTAFWNQSATTSHTHFLSSYFESSITDFTIHITNVYGPSDHRHSPAFLSELCDLAPSAAGPWVVIGDFNLLRSTEEKNTDNINNSLTTAFNDAIDQLQLMEIPLLGRSFT